MFRFQPRCLFKPCGAITACLVNVVSLILSLIVSLKSKHTTLQCILLSSLGDEKIAWTKDKDEVQMWLLRFRHLSIEKYLTYIPFWKGGSGPTVSFEASQNDSWREADWVGDGMDAEILPLGSIKLLKEGACGRVQGEGLTNFVIEMKQEILMTMAT